MIRLIKLILISSILVSTSCVITHANITIDDENKNFHKEYSTDTENYRITFSSGYNNMPPFHKKWYDERKEGCYYIFINTTKKVIDEYPIKPNRINKNIIKNKLKYDFVYEYHLGVFEVIKVFFVNDKVELIDIKYFLG